MRMTLWRVWATAALVLAAGCKVSNRNISSAGSGGPVVSAAELESRMQALEKRMGPDAYSQPEAMDIMRQALQVPLESPDRTQAEKLAELIKAKKRIVYQALEDNPTTLRDSRKPPENHGPRTVTGEPPNTPEQIQLAERTGVGVSRDDLLARYGSCLVRQTWIRGSHGGPTVELFQVTPDCRDRLKPRLFEVADAKVLSASPGTMDQVMRGQSRDHAPRPQL